MPANQISRKNRIQRAEPGGRRSPKIARCGRPNPTERSFRVPGNRKREKKGLGKTLPSANRQKPRGGSDFYRGRVEKVKKKRGGVSRSKKE